MRRVLLVAFLLLWVGTPAGALTLRPDGPHFEPPRGRPAETPPFDVPVGPGFETPPSGSPFEPPPDGARFDLPRGYSWHKHHRWHMLRLDEPLGLRPARPFRNRQQTSQVPEPGLALLVGLGVALTGARRFSRRS